MPLGIGRILLALALAVGIAGPVVAQSRPAAATGPTAAPDGRQTTMNMCAGACHGADHFVGAHYTAEEWRKIVLQMVSNGAQLFPAEIDAITSYLATNFGPKGAGSSAN